MRFPIHIFLGLCFLIVYQPTIAQNRGGLKVFIENAEEDDIIGATVQVLDDGKQVTGGVTDFTGFVYLPKIDEGAYDVVIRHIGTITDTLPVSIRKNIIHELRMHLQLIDWKSQDQMVHLDFNEDTFKTTDDILRLPHRSPRGDYRCVCTPSAYPMTPKMKSNPLGVEPMVVLKGGLTVFAIDENGNAFFGAHVEAELTKPYVDTFTQNENETHQEMFGKHAVTNNEGIAQIKDLPSGNYKVSVSHVSLGGVRTFDITIEPHTTYELKLERALYTELPPFSISAVKGYKEPFFDPYGQDKAKRSSIYFEMPPINK